MTERPSRPPSLAAQLTSRGFVYLTATETGHAGIDMRGLPGQWENLAEDPSFRGEGFSRQRRYARVLAASDAGDRVRVVRLPHEDFFQAATENKLYSGVARRFEPCAQALLDSPTMLRLLELDLSVVAGREVRWDIGLHQVRVRWTAGSTPESTAPEGRHNDGHCFIAMHLVGLAGSSAGGVSRIFAPASTQKPVFSVRLSAPGDTLIIDDRRVLHEVTPIMSSGGDGHRDMLIIDFRRQVTDDGPCAEREGTAESVALPGAIT
jgi:hypothetical protein